MDTNIKIQGTFEVKGGGAAVGGGKTAGTSRPPSPYALGTGGLEMGGGSSLGGTSQKEAKRLELNALKMRLKNAKTEETVFQKIIQFAGPKLGVPAGITKGVSGMMGMGGGGGAGAGAAAGGGAAAAAAGIAAVVVIGALILKKMIENSEAVKAIRAIIDMTLGAVLDTLFGSLFVLNNMLASVLPIGDLLKSMGGVIKDTAVYLLTGFGNAIIKLGEWIKLVFWDSPIKSFTNAIEGTKAALAIIDSTSKSLQAGFNKFQSQLSELPGQLMAGAKKAWDDGMKWLREFGDTFTKYVTKGAMDGLNLILSGPKGWGETFTNVLSGIGAGFSNLYTMLTNPVTTFQNALGALNFSSFTKFLNLSFDKVIDFFNLGTAFETATAFVKSLTGTISTVTSGDAGSLAGNIWDAIT